MNSNSKILKNKEISGSNEREKNMLTLRKREYMQKNLSRIMHTIDDTKEFELSDEDFPNMMINLNDNYDSIMMLSEGNDIKIAYWLYILHKLLSKDYPSTNHSHNISNTIESLTYNQVNSIIDILVAYSIESKLKYEACCILINLIYYTDKFNHVYTLRAKDIYNNILLLLNNESKDKRLFIIIRHMEWLLASMINNKTQCDLIRQEVNLPYLAQIIFTYIDTYYDKDTSLCNIQMNFIIEVNMNFLDFLLHNTDTNLRFQLKYFIEIIALHIKNSLKNNHITVFKESIEPLYNYITSPECLEIIAINSDLVNIFIEKFDENKTIQVILIQIIKKSDNSVMIIKKTDLFNKIVVRIMKSCQDISIELYSSIVIENTIKLLNAVISYDSFSSLIDILITDTKFITLLKKFFDHYDISVQFVIMGFYKKCFENGTECIQRHLVKINLHIFCIQELKKYHDIVKNSKKPSLIYHKNISLIILLLRNFIIFGENDLINRIKESLENEDIIDLLIQLQFITEENVYDHACELLNRYWKEDDAHENDIDINDF